MVVPVKARDISRPEPGFFKLKMVRGGAFVPCRIFLPCPIDPEFGHPTDRSRHLAAEIDGADVNVDRVWTSGERIGAAEFQFLSDDAAWCRDHAPAEPRANPKSAVDVRKTQPVF